MKNLQTQIKEIHEQADFAGIGNALDEDQHKKLQTSYINHVKNENQLALNIANIKNQKVEALIKAKTSSKLNKTLQNKLSLLEREHDEAKATITTQTSQIEKLEAEVAELTKYEAEAKNLREEVKTLEADRQQKLSKISQIEKNFQTLKLDHEELQSERNDLALDKSSLKLDLEEATESLNQTTASLEKTKKNLKETESKLEKSRDQVTKLTVKGKKYCETIEQINEEFNTQKEETQKKIQEFTEKVDTLQRQSSSQAKEIVTYQTILSKQETRVKEQVEKIAQLTETSGEQAAIIVEMNDCVKTLTSNLKEAQTQVAELKKQNAFISEVRTSLEIKLKELGDTSSAEIAELKQKIEELCKEIESSQQENKNAGGIWDQREKVMKDKISLLEGELATVRDQLNKALEVDE